MIVFSILHGITSSSNQIQLEGVVGGEEPSTLLSLCLEHVNTKLVECSHTDSLSRVGLLLSVLPLYFLFLSSSSSLSALPPFTIPGLPFCRSNSPSIIPSSHDAAKHTDGQTNIHI